MIEIDTHERGVPGDEICDFDPCRAKDVGFESGALRPVCVPFPPKLASEPESPRTRNPVLLV